MASEDDGLGWINPFNLTNCRVTGEGMLHAQSKTKIKQNKILESDNNTTNLNLNNNNTKKNKKSGKNKIKENNNKIEFNESNIEESNSNNNNNTNTQDNENTLDKKTEDLINDLCCDHDHSNVDESNFDLEGFVEIKSKSQKRNEKMNEKNKQNQKYQKKNNQQSSFNKKQQSQSQQPQITTINGQTSIQLTNNDNNNNNNLSETPTTRLVSCMTTDYAMQNILLQMGLQLISTTGYQIQSIRRWVLRCVGCYTIHYNMKALFCNNCGLNYLQRISTDVNSKGGLRLHFKKNYQYNTKGQVYSLPAPGKQGRFEGELLLREDQLLSGIWKQKVIKIQKNIKSQFGDEITDDVGIHINKGMNIKVGLGKRNPNAVKGRERRGKRKTNK